MLEPVDILVIGAGPAGATAAALARRRGLSVRVIERQRFPRFQIGESLLPHCLDLLEEAGLLEAVENFGFQYKDGAQIARHGRHVDFLFSMKTCAGHGYAYEVTRADFDLLLAQGAAAQGAELRWDEEILDVAFDAHGAEVLSRDLQGRESRHRAGFVLDASGYGRVLPRLLGLDRPSDFPVRTSLFTHVHDGIPDGEFDRDKIRVAIHPEHDDVWYWMIPLSEGRMSIGIVAPKEFMARYAGSPRERWQALIQEESSVRQLLRNARLLWEPRQLSGYACGVSQLYGERYALLGNAGEFLDPVFSSGVTIALKSASLAVPLVARTLAGEAADWQREFAEPLRTGIETFRGYVETWYSGHLPTVMFSELQPQRLRAMMCGVLGGFAWDPDNPYVRDSGRRIRSLAQVIRNTQPSHLAALAAKRA